MEPAGPVDPRSGRETIASGARRVDFGGEFDLSPRVCLQFETAGIPDCSRDPDGWYALARLLDKPVLLPDGMQRQIGHSLSFRYDIASLDHFGMSPTGKVIGGSAQVLLPGLWRRTNMQVTFLADRAKGEMYLLLDGELALKYLGQAGGAEGRTVEFILNPPPGIRVEGMVLSEWKGAADALTARASAGDAIWLHDQTVLAGPIEGIRDGAVVRGDGDTVPLGRVSRIQLDSARAVRFRRAANDVRVTVAGGEQLTLSAPQLDERGLTGTSEALGPVCIPAAAVRRLDFRPYDPPPAKR